MKKVAWLLIAVGTLVSFSSTLAQTELVFWAGAEDPGMLSIFEQYEGEHPDVKLTLEIVPYNNYSQKIIAAAQTGTLPDVLLLQPKVPATFAGLGVLAPVTDLVEELGGETEFYARDLGFNTLNGDIWGVPFYVYPHVLFYRQDMFDAAGLTSVPETWEEFSTAAAALTEGDRYGYLAFFNDPVAHTLHQWMATNDADTFDADLNIVFNSPNTVETLDFLKSMWDAGVMPPGATTYNMGDARVAFANNQGAMIISSTSFLNVLKDQSPDLFATLGVAPVPHNKGDATYYAFRSIGLPKDGPNQAAAEDFIRWLYNPDNLISYFVQADLGYMPMTKSLVNGDAYWSADAIAPYEPLIRPALEAAANGFMPGLNAVNNPFAGLFETQDVYRGTLMDVIVNGTSPSEAAATAAKKMQEIMDQ